MSILLNMTYCDNILASIAIQPNIITYGISLFCEDFPGAVHRPIPGIVGVRHVTERHFP